MKIHKPLIFWILQYWEHIILLNIIRAFNFYFESKPPSPPFLSFKMNGFVVRTWNWLGSLGVVVQKTNCL